MFLTRDQLEGSDLCREKVPKSTPGRYNCHVQKKWNSGMHLQTKHEPWTRLVTRQPVV